MLIKLNKNESCTICMNHKEINKTIRYTIMRIEDDLFIRKFMPNKDTEINMGKDISKQSDST